MLGSIPQTCRNTVAARLIGAERLEFCAATGLIHSATNFHLGHTSQIEAWSCCIGLIPADSNLYSRTLSRAASVSAPRAWPKGKAHQTQPHTIRP
jgi:hypothetical protein